MLQDVPAQIEDRQLQVVAPRSDMNIHDSSHTSITIPKRMNHLKLVVGDAHLEERVSRLRVIIIQELNQIIEFCFNHSVTPGRRVGWFPGIWPRAAHPDERSGKRRPYPVSALLDNAV